jgi:hypothetical protein
MFSKIAKGPNFVVAGVCAAIMLCAWRPAAAGAAESIKKSIKGWTTCDGIANDAEGVARAFSAASRSSFTLVVDCPARISVGMDIARVVFFEDGTDVEFTPSGKFIVDNVFIPTFVIANTKNIRMTNWNIEYDASLPVNHNVEGSTNNGQIVRGEHPSGAFNDRRLTPWLAANRRIVFDARQGRVTSFWPGPTNVCAVFYVTGDSSGIAVTGMKVSAPASAGGERFVPVVWSLNPNFRSNQTVDAKTPFTAQYFAVPHDLRFSDISLDGTYMGWVGGAQNAVFENIHSRRYGDLQDAGGGTVGGVNTWFAPPHLLYLSYSPTVDPALFNRDIAVRNVVDEGVRIGKARDFGANPALGNALSLKIGCVHCSVNNYATARPDGFIDVLSSDGLTVSNVNATFDSSFLNNIYPGWRFPKPPYKNVSFENIVLRDSAPTTVHLPIENAADKNNQGIHFKNVHVGINAWSGVGRLPVPSIAGLDGDSSLDFDVDSDGSSIKNFQSGGVSLTLRAAPRTVQVGGSTNLDWESKNGGTCSLKGAWSGSAATEGSRTVTLPSAGAYDFTIECAGGSVPARVTVSVTSLSESTNPNK